jgi:hypothetical protein
MDTNGVGILYENKKINVENNFQPEKPSVFTSDKR